jgi:hypothetical protein
VNVFRMIDSSGLMMSRPEPFIRLTGEVRFAIFRAPPPVKARRRRP